MVWNVYYHDINSGKIELLDIFRHSSFSKEVKDRLKKCKNKEEFAKEIKSSLMYYFWSKCEYEIIIAPWCGGRNTDSIKIDVYDQVMANFNVFVDYLWSSKNNPKS